ncbi:MAG: ubiquinone biosynthesis accessory factor UbiJ [Fluviibacter sp.]|jgi:ubiquinone biosynthesis protein UbiJ
MLHSLSLPVINRALRDDPWAASRLAAFAGASLRISMAERSLMRYTIEPDGLLAAHEVFGDDEPTLSIDLPGNSASLFMSHGRQGVIKAAKIRGNIDLANALNDVMDQIRPDPEAFLASKIGDIAAHRLMGFAQAFKQGAEQLVTRLKDQFTEHVAEGQSVIVPTPEVRAFMDDVDTLRNDVARLQQRIDRLIPR